MITSYNFSLIIIFIGLCMDIFGVWILSKGFIRDSDRIEKMSRSVFGHNTEIVKDLKDTTKDTKNGIKWLISGFGIQGFGIIIQYFI